MSPRRRLPLLWGTLLLLAGVWLLLRYALPYLAMWAAGAARPLPLPGAAFALYLILAVAGVLVYVSIRDEWAREFLQPIRALLRGPDPTGPKARGLRAARLALLLLVPPAAGGAVYARMARPVQSPTVLRIQHPTIPGAYERLTNPYREPGEETVRRWMAEQKLTGSLEEGRRAYREAALAEGRVIFQIHCRPCHGDAADGQGPLARGFRLKPADFTDPGTIATVVEAYAFWRVTEGGPGLPPEGTPWDSAMPVWKRDLTEEQRWKAVMAAYDLAGVEPRKPERLGAGRPPGRGWGLLPGIQPPRAWAQARPPETPENIERGRRIYVKRCQVCHGEHGDGRGPVAPFLDPRPRDFTAGVYKLRSTASGEPPTDDDLFRVVTRGVPGTAMSGWATLSEEDRRLVIAYIKRFSDVFRDKGSVIRPTREVPASPEVIARGREVYRQAKCWECHGERGRGDGPSAPTLKDDAGHPIRAANLTKGWRLKGGREARDIFMRLSTGLDGTPMPSYADSLGEDDRWALAHYVRTLQTAEEPSAEVVLRAARVSGGLPRDPDDPRWRAAPALTVPLAGQALAKPRWEPHSVDAVTVRAVFDDAGISFLLEWDDPFRDVEHRPGPGPELVEFSYPRLPLDRPPGERLRDAIRLQFPLTVGRGPERPHFFLGSPGRPVVLWHWKADLQEAGGRPVVKERGEGFERPVVEMRPEAQDVTGRGRWEHGRWRVVMTRARVPRDRTADVSFEVGRLIPFAIQAWDGSNGEQGLLMSLSTWNVLVLEAPASARVYVFPGVVAALAALGEWWLVRRVRR